MANLSAKLEYACIAVVDLATEYSAGEPVRLKAIAERHGIPSRFLVQIMLQLKSAGLVNSIRGAAGGYQLNRAPSSISLGDVSRIMEGGDEGPKSNLADATSTSMALMNAWNQVHAAENEILNSITIADLAAQSRVAAGDMYYI